MALPLNIFLYIKGLERVVLYLFILTVEVLACMIRQDVHIRGINVKEKCLKILQCADDTNGIVSDLKSAKRFLFKFVVEQ